MKIEHLPQNKKFADMVHYICAHGGSRVGAIKLNKILWLMDTAQFIKTGSSITGGSYVKRKKGPVPKTILRTLEILEAEGKLSVGKSQCGPYVKTDYVSKIEPDTSLISKDEMEAAAFFIDYVCDNHTADSISELTHDIVWESAHEGEEIPLEAVLASKAGDITEHHINWADSIIERKPN